MKNFRLTVFKVIALFIAPTMLATNTTYAQEKKVSDYFSISSYGRIGADWSFENEGSIGRRLNLNNMGSVGGRLEEQDYLELAPSFHFLPINSSDSTVISANLRFAFYSNSLSFFGNSSTNSLGGLGMSIPEMYVEAKNIAGKPINMWIGARMYQDYDIHIADYFYFNDHTSQGFGIEYKNTSFATFFVSSTDTSSTLPPYFYLNFQTGTSVIALRQRSIFVLEQDIAIGKLNNLTLLGELHYLGNDKSADSEIEDSLGIILDYENDYGFVAGARLETDLSNILGGGYNRLAVRYGTRIANGGEGGLSFTWLTYGAPNLDSKNYKGAYSLSLVNDFLINTNSKNSLNIYAILTNSKGAADSDSTANTYFGREVYNNKLEFTIGLRDAYYFTNMFHLLSEVHYSQRQDGIIPTYSMLKFSLAPTLTPTGNKDYFARPHLRFVTSVARYNDSAMENLYSPYLSLVGKQRWGYYFGFKAEWWL